MALVLVQVATGLSWTQFGEESSARSVLFSIHMFSGIAILILMVVRLAWRRTSPWRPLPQDVPQESGCSRGRTTCCSMAG